MRPIVILAITLIILLGVFYWWKGGKFGSQPKNLTTITIGDAKLSVELSQTPAEISQGLSGRTRVLGDGMLFVLGNRQQATFWMKEMRFPLDIIWIDGAQVIGVAANVPHPAAADGETKVVQAPGPVTHVLELPAGQAAKLKIASGSAVRD